MSTCQNLQYHLLFVSMKAHRHSLFTWHFFAISRAANWNLSEPLWTGRMRVTARGNAVNLKLEDKNTGTLYANCPIESYPGTLMLIVCVCVRNRFRWPWQIFHGCDLRKLFNAIFTLSHRIKQIVCISQELPLKLSVTVQGILLFV